MVEEANEAFEQLSGYDLGELAKRSIFGLYGSSVRGKLRRSVEKGGRRATGDASLLTSRGAKLVVTWRTLPMKLQGDKSVMIVNKQKR